MHGESVPVIFGLKLKQFREERGYSLKECAKRASMSPSYLNEIEKGKKYPKTEKIMALSQALEVAYDEMVSIKLEKELNPLEAVLDSPVIRELPLQLFGISQGDIIKLLTRAPHEAGALVRTIVDIARSYDMQVEHFFYAMLRSYQEAHENYFPEIEEAAQAFSKDHPWVKNTPVDYQRLAEVLYQKWGVTLDESTLNDHPDLSGFRSIWLSGTPETVLVNAKLSQAQKTFQLAREIGYRQMDLKVRGVASSRAEVSSFEQVLNDFNASYFAGAIMLNETVMVKELTEFLKRPTWDGEAFLEMIEAHQVTPEIYMYRLTQILPQHFNLKLIHFLRFNDAENGSAFRLSKQFNLSQVLIPTGIGLNEHYCRRWLSVEIIRELQQNVANGGSGKPIVGTQISRFLDSEVEFFCISVARPLVLTEGANTSVTVGFRMDDVFRKTVAFSSDAQVPRQSLNETCERCTISTEDCKERAAPPRIVNHKKNLENRKQTLHNLMEDHNNPPAAS